MFKEWCGIRDEELSTLTGIKGCIFVHASGFIGGNETREGVLSMARKTLEHRNSVADKTNGSTWQEPSKLHKDSQPHVSMFYFSAVFGWKLNKLKNK